MPSDRTSRGTLHDLEEKVKANHSWRTCAAKILFGGAILIAFFVFARVVHAGNKQPVHLATDWSHRHLIFSPPKNLAQQLRLSSNPRYVQQWVRRNAKRGDQNAWRWNRAPVNPGLLHGDWNVFLGIDASGTAASVGAGVFPAKYSFDASSASCASDPQPDFVVYNSSLAGSATPMSAFATGTFTGVANIGDEIVVVANGTRTLTMTAGTKNANISPGVGTFNNDRSSSAYNVATNLANAINIPGNGDYVGVTASKNGASVILTAITPGSAGNSIAVSYVANGSTVFTWSSSSLVDGADGVPTIAAFDNLYSSCSGTTPSPYWAYNTGIGASAVTSASLSYDGTQVAFVQNVSGAAQLVLLRWAANNGTIASPVALTPVSNASYRTCTAPCMTTINFHGGAADTNSSPFYDFAPSDTLYVGDDNGILHKFTGVFNGTPAETTAGGWPVTLSSGHVTTGPVYDEGSGKVFIADNGGHLYSVTASGNPPTKITSGSLVATAGHGIDETPILDESNGELYVFARGDRGTNIAERAGVYQFSTGFTNGSTGTAEAIVSTNSTIPATALYPGDFDNLYYNSANGTGNMYVCGTNAGITAMWHIPINASVMGTPVPGPTLTTANVACSPVTEFNDVATDRMFVSVTGSAQTASPVSCPTNTTGCIMSFDITNPATWGTGKATSATALVLGGASGVVVDSYTTIGGASEVYYTPLSTTAGNCTTAGLQGFGGCAIQASQAGLN